MFKSVIVILAWGAAALGAKGQVNITTRQVDLAHTGVNSQETILTPANVSAQGSFGLLFTHSMFGQCYSEPLYVSGVKLADNSIHNIVYLATQHDDIYAFDADNATGSNFGFLWHDSLLPPGAITIPSGDTGTADVTPEVGITATPVIDLSTKTLYTVTAIAIKNASNSSYAQYLHALDLATGAEKFGGPVQITATFHGNGSSADTVSNGTFSFNPLRYHGRAALVLYNGIVYVTYASHGDAQPFHGVILGYNASSLALVKQFITTPNGPEGGIWQSGTGPAIDSAGNMYVSTGNGDFGQTASPFTTDTDWGESYIKLPTSGNFNVSFSNSLNWFTPKNFSALSNGDYDLGSSGILLLPDQAGPHPHLFVSGGKAAIMYVIDRDNMGGLNPVTDNSVQEIAVGGSTLDCTPSYFNGFIYYATGGGPLSQRAVGYNSTTGAYIATSGNNSNNTYNAKGQGIFISSNGTANGLCWIVNPNTPSTLDVYNATNVTGNPIYSFTAQIPGSPVVNCTATKFNLGTVVNGKLYFTAYDSGNLAHLFVLGLLTGATTAPTAPSNLVATASSSSQVTLNWTDNSTNESGFKVERATQAGGPFTQIGLTGANIATFSDSGLSPQTTYYYKVLATNNVGDSAASNVSGTITFSPYTPAGLVAYWNFDEGSGAIANDVTGNGHTGTLNGEIGWVPGFIGNSAINFHGTGNAISNVTVPNSASLQFASNQSFTLSAWVLAGGLRSSDEAVIAKSRDQGNYYGIWINSANKWVFRGPGGDVVGSAATTTAWTHVAVVQNGSTGTRLIYVNGVVAGSGAAQAANGAGDLWIGQANGITQPFPGTIDEVRLYNRALAASEITTLMGPPVLQAVSRQVHGSAGTFDLVFPTSSTVPIEPREGLTVGSYNLILSFSNAVSGITATLGLQAGQTGSIVGTVGSLSYDTSGKIVTITLTGVGNAQRLNLHLSGIQPGNGIADIPLNVLWGDVNGDGTVNILDLGQVRVRSGQAVTSTSYQYDINADGAINILDLGQTRLKSGTSLP
jgi:hypothetical protein